MLHTTPGSKEEMSSLFWKGRSVSPYPFSRDFSYSWDTLATHPTTPCAAVGCRNDCIHWPDSIWGRRGKGRTEVTFSFNNQDCGTLDMTASRTNHQYPTHHEILQHPPHPSICWLLTRQEGQQNTGDSRKLWNKTSPWIWEAMGLRTLGAGLMVGHQQTKSDQRSCNEVASPYSTDLKKFLSYHSKTLSCHQRWRLSRPPYASCG